jgi:hypothetical protein
MTVLMFKKRFVEPIIRGRKRHTIRRNRKIPIPIGDLLSLRHWEGKGYRSPQVTFGSGICVSVLPILVAFHSVRINETTVIATSEHLNAFAWSDGFDDWNDLMAYYRAEKIRLPFDNAELIEWRDP